MSDSISRQAAIDAVISLCDDCDSDYCGSCRVICEGEKDVRKVLEDLPSAHLPDIRLDVIDDLVKEFASKGGNSYFVIDGQKYPTDTGYAMEGIELFVEKLKERASKEIEHPKGERKKGKWYKPVGMMPPEYAGVYRCSKCGEIAMRDWKHHKQVLSNFCPNCGADMRGEQDEID